MPENAEMPTLCNRNEVVQKTAVLKKRYAIEDGVPRNGYRVQTPDGKAEL